MNHPNSHSSEEQAHADTPRENTNLLSQILRVGSGLVQHVRGNPSLRREVIQLLRYIEEAITPPEPPENGLAPVETPEDVNVQKGIADQLPTPEPTQPSMPAPIPITVDSSMLRDLETGMASAGAFAATETTTRHVRRTVGLDDIARSCRVKAETCLWAVERKRLIADQRVDFRMEVAPTDKALIEKACALGDCFLWMTTSSAPMPEPMELYLQLADRYEDVADAADLLAELAQQSDEQEMLEAAILLGAEAHAALREAVSGVGYRGEDDSQIDFFQWLRRTAQERGIFINRYMRIADKPEKSEIESLAGRIVDLQERHRMHVAGKKLTANKLKTIKHHLSQISPERDNSYHWNKVFTVIAEIVPKYLRANDVRVRELLIKIVDEIPEETVLPQAGQDVLEAIDSFLATRPEAAPVEDTQIELSPEMTALKKNLKGKTIVIIGGDTRPYAKDALRAAFDLREVVWITTREHQSPETFRPHIRAPGVAVLLLAIRWASHSFVAVRDYCKDENVPFVRLPTGYNPTQVAHQIMSQVPALAKSEQQTPTANK